jgi:hypothetical protein
MFSHSCPFKALCGKVRQRFRPIKTGFGRSASCLSILEIFGIFGILEIA